MGPVRLQLSRKKGFNLQAHSRAANGLPAVNVARPSKYGNPYVVGGNPSNCYASVPDDAAMAVRWYREAVEKMLAKRQDSLASLCGKNLACWCAPDQPCHADVLLELANGFRCDPAKAAGVREGE